jgi:hypothetical protein
VVDDGVAIVAQRVGDDGRGALFPMGEFGVGVEVFVECEEVRGERLPMGSYEGGGEKSHGD